MIEVVYSKTNGHIRGAEVVNRTNNAALSEVVVIEDQVDSSELSDLVDLFHFWYEVEALETDRVFEGLVLVVEDPTIEIEELTQITGIPIFRTLEEALEFVSLQSDIQKSSPETASVFEKYLRQILNNKESE